MQCKVKSSFPSCTYSPAEWTLQPSQMSQANLFFFFSFLVILALANIELIKKVTKDYCSLRERGDKGDWSSRGGERWRGVSGKEGSVEEKSGPPQLTWTNMSCWETRGLTLCYYTWTPTPLPIQSCVSSCLSTPRHPPHHNHLNSFPHPHPHPSIIPSLITPTPRSFTLHS